MFIDALLVLLTLSSLIVFHDCASCGTSPEIIPKDCSCSDDLTIECGGSGDLDLKRFFNLLSHNIGEMRKTFKKFTLKNTRINELEKYTFAGITFETIEIIGAKNLSLIHRDAFSETNQFIKTFYVEDTSITSCVVPECQDYQIFSAISSMTNLESLTIKKSNLTQIPSNAFHPLSGEFNNLHIIQMTANKIRKIGGLAFFHCCDLTDLLLADNEIDLISSESLVFNCHSNKPLLIDLSNNKIDSIEPGSFESRSFKDLKRPAVIDFRKNKNLQFLNETVFADFLKLNEKNRIEMEELNCTDCRNYWLVKDQLYNPQLVTIKCSNGKLINDINNFKNCCKEKSCPLL